MTEVAPPPPAPVSAPTRSYGRKRKAPVDDSTHDEIPAQKISTDSPAPAQDRTASPHQETIPAAAAAPAIETTYDEQKKVRGGRARRQQSQQFNGSNELKTTASNNNDILSPSAFDTAATTADHAEKTDGDSGGGGGVGGVDEFEKPSVKLVISKKKGSIFKSRAIEGEAGENIKQKRHVYKHKWDDDLPEDEKSAADDA